MFTSAAFQTLLEQESRLLNASLSRERRGFQLLLEPTGLPTGIPLSSTALRLQVQADGMFNGPMRGNVHALPFASNSVDVIVIRHAVEYVRQPQALVREALRVLAGQGTLLVTGLCQISLWSPWLWQQMRGSGVHFQPVSTVRWRQWLDAAAVNVSRIDRFGPLTPWADNDLRMGSVIGAGFILLAYKNRMPRQHMPMTNRARHVPAVGSTACVSRRRCA